MSQCSHQHFDFNFNLLTRLGFWNIQTRSSAKRRFYCFFQSFMIVFFSSFLILQYVDLYISRKDLEKFNFNLCSTVTLTVTLIKNLRSMYKLGDINKLRKDLYRDADNETDQECKAILVKASLEMRFLNRLFYGMCYLLIAGWLSTPLIDYKSGARKLPIRQWFPFDIQPTPNYELAYTYQVLSCCFFVSTIVASDLSTFGLLIQISTEYDILNSILRKLNTIYENIDKEERGIKFKYSSHRDTAEIIRDVVRHHQQIILRIQQFEDHFNINIGCQVVGVTMLLAIIGLDVTIMSTELNTRFITQLGYLATALTDLFFWCLYGTRVQYKSFDLVETVFNTPWYIMNPRFRPYLSFIILRAQNPPLITGGGLLYMNFNVFLKVLRTTYNMLALFRQVASKNKIRPIE